jgi:hypothetical protein
MGGAHIFGMKRCELSFPKFSPARFAGDENQSIILCDVCGHPDLLKSRRILFGLHCRYARIGFRDGQCLPA